MKQKHKTYEIIYNLTKDVLHSTSFCSLKKSVEKL